MAQAGYIKHLYETENKSKSEIARITGLNYRTVSKYAEKSDWNAEKLPNVDPSTYPSLGKYIPTINKRLENDSKVPRKQRHTAKRIFIRLCEEEGYTGCYSSIKRYIRKKKYIMNQEVSAGCLLLAHPLGYGQGDFGEFVYYDGNGDQNKAYSFTISFPYSNKAYIQVFPSQNRECLLTGMRRIFEHIGGVPVRIRFDNLATAVAQVLEGHERVLTDGFMRFMLHYRFEADFCNPASGNEKGNVENKVSYLTRFFEAKETKGKDRRDALSLLSEMIDDGNADITADILILSQENGRTDTDSIRQAYYALAKDRTPPEPLALLSDVPKLHYSPDLSAYDDLTEGAEND